MSERSDLIYKSLRLLSDFHALQVIILLTWISNRMKNHYIRPFSVNVFNQIEFPRTIVFEKAVSVC